MRRVALVVLLLFAVVPAVAWAKGDEMIWAHSWNEAVEQASARNVPIFISFHQDG